MTTAVSILIAAVTFGTWNGQWFPSGRAEHRASPEVEARTIAAAGRMLREGLSRVDPAGTNDIVLCLNEIRGPKEARALCEATGITNLRVAVVTGYRRRDRFDQQQDVIATTLPVVDASWSRWKVAGPKTPPRGYAKARLLFSPTVTATVYAVHLKSNYGQTNDDMAYTNRVKRALAAGQLVEQERPRRGERASTVVVAGDFNADRWGGGADVDTLFVPFAEAGFANALEQLPASERATHPSRNRRWRDSALDYIMHRGLSPTRLPVIVPAKGLSDHNPVFVPLEAAR